MNEPILCSPVDTRSPSLRSPCLRPLLTTLMLPLMLGVPNLRLLMDEAGLGIPARAFESEKLKINTRSHTRKNRLLK